MHRKRTKEMNWPITPIVTKPIRNYQNSDLKEKGREN